MTTGCPHGVDDAWGQRCGTTRSVAIHSTIGDAGCPHARWVLGGKPVDPAVDGGRQRRTTGLLWTGGVVVPGDLHRASTGSADTQAAPTLVIPRFHTTDDDDQIFIKAIAINHRTVDLRTTDTATLAGWRWRHSAGQNRTFPQEASNEVPG
jgi:hypothetical protein